MLVIIALLVGQAVCELALPQYTSNIVDVGIQNGGVETEAPEVMRQETMELLLRFLNEQEKQTVQGAYVLYGAGEAEDSILEDYPAAETEGVYVLERREPGRDRGDPGASGDCPHDASFLGRRGTGDARDRPGADGAECRYRS